MSAAPKFTPGPWSVEDIGANCLRVRGKVSIASDTPAISTGHYEAIATVTQREPHPRYGGGIDYDTRDANARLIAAAPDLYAALAEIELVLHPDADEHNPLCQGTHTWDEVIGRIVERARAALAKVQP